VEFGRSKIVSPTTYGYRGSEILTLSNRIVGADDGIYELHVNQMRRKLFPSVSLR
jgi:hypothetical protein